MTPRYHCHRSKRSPFDFIFRLSVSCRTRLFDIPITTNFPIIMILVIVHRISKSFLFDSIACRYRVELNCSIPLCLISPPSCFLSSLIGYRCPLDLIHRFSMSCRTRLFGIPMTFFPNHHYGRYRFHIQRFAEGGDYDDQELNELEELLQEPRKEASFSSWHPPPKKPGFLTRPPLTPRRCNKSKQT